MRIPFAIVLLAFAAVALAAPAADPPETVVVIYSPRAGKEAEVDKLIRTHFATLKRLRLVTADPHVTYRDKDEGGRPIFVDILTWKSHAAPDDVPPEVQTIWTAMEAACEKRDGRRGIAFHEVERLK